MASVARFAAALSGFPRKLLEAARYRSAFFDTPYRTGIWVAEARGNGRLESVVLTDGAARFEVACDLAAIGYGLVPNTELARLLGCATRGDAVAVDERQQTSVPGVCCAGEPCGVAGVDVALAEGQIAGLAAAGVLEDAADRGALASARDRGRRLAAAMQRAFRPRRELRRGGPSRHRRLPLRGRALREPRRLRERPRGQALLPRRHGPVPGPRLRPGPRVSLRLGFGYRTPAASSRRGWAASSHRNKERA